jgi:hypothetical protein
LLLFFFSFSLFILISSQSQLIQSNPDSQYISNQQLTRSLKIQSNKIYSNSHLKSQGSQQVSNHNLHASHKHHIHLTISYISQDRRSSRTEEENHIRMLKNKKKSSPPTHQWRLVPLRLPVGAASPRANASWPGPHASAAPPSRNRLQAQATIASRPEPRGPAVPPSRGRRRLQAAPMRPPRLLAEAASASRPRSRPAPSAPLQPLPAADQDELERIEEGDKVVKRTDR